MEREDEERLFASLDKFDSFPMEYERQMTTYLHERDHDDNRSESVQGSNDSVESVSSSNDDRLKRHRDGELKVARMYRPRIPKTDFRRNYAIMWANVFNSCDKAFMMQHLKTFYHPDVAVRQNDVREDHINIPHKIPHFQPSARGIQYLSELWYAGMTEAPDLVCALRHTFVKVRADGSAVVKCCFALKGTLVANLDRSKQEDVDRIARYQARKAAGRRDITITEAAVAAVAPASMLMPRPSSTTPGSSNTSVDGSDASIASSTASSTLKLKSANPAKRAEKGEATVPGGVLRKKGALGGIKVNEGAINVKVEPNDVNAQSLATVDSDEASSSSPRDGTQHHSADLDRSEVANDGDKGRGVRSSDRSTNYAFQVGVTKSTSKPQVDTTASPLQSQSRSGSDEGAPAPNTSAASHPAAIGVRNSQVDINWLALADYAYTAGTLEPCKPKSQKKYFYSSDASQNTSLSHSRTDSPLMEELRCDSTDRDKPAAVSVATLIPSAMKNVDEDTSMRIDADTSSCRSVAPASDISTAAAAESAALSEAIDTLLSAQMQRTVITASVDCICGIEFEMSPEGTVTSVVLHYFR